jgi:putative ABC transport system permease protein
MPALHLGPILRSIGRRKGTFSLVVLELASGFTIISCLFIAASWYLGLGLMPSGHVEADLLTVTVTSAAATADPAAARAAAAERQERDIAAMASVPGVAGVVPSSSSMLDERWGFPTEFFARPLADGPNLDQLAADAFGWVVRTRPNAVAVLGLRFVEGGLRADAPARDLEDGVVLTRRLRDHLFPPGAAVVGREIRADEMPPLRILGVVEDVSMHMPFMPHSRCVAFRFNGTLDERENRYFVRTQPGRRAEAQAGLAAAMGPARADRLVSVLAFEPRNSRHHDIASGLVILLATFGLIVGLIALLGAIAVSSFLVAERTRQIGIRRALGATRQDIIRYFLVENAISTACGTGLGIFLALGMFVLMRNVFAELELKWRYIALTAFLLWFDATLAAMIPARRAANIPPSVASRGL